MRLDEAQKVHPGQLGVDHVVHQLWLAILHDTATRWQECTPHIVPCTALFSLSPGSVSIQQHSMWPYLLPASMIVARHFGSSHDSAMRQQTHGIVPVAQMISSTSSLDPSTKYTV